MSFFAGLRWKNSLKRFSETDKEKKRIGQRDFPKRTKAFSKLSILNNFIRYTEKKKWVEWIFPVSILIFSIGYTQFPRWLQQERLREAATTLMLRIGTSFEMTETVKIIQKSSAIVFDFWLYAYSCVAYHIDFHTICFYVYFSLYMSYTRGLLYNNPCCENIPRGKQVILSACIGMKKFIFGVALAS